MRQSPVQAVFVERLLFLANLGCCGLCCAGQLRCFIGARLLKFPAVNPGITFNHYRTAEYISRAILVVGGRMAVCELCEFPKIRPGGGS